MKSSLAAFLLAIILLIPAAEPAAQPALPTPQLSPKASVMQTVGVTDITITYHRPGVRNRKIWGELVPYNEVWRAGANENTTITFADPVRVGGKDLPAGTYGLHIIPTQSTWTVILSTNSTSWGSTYYNESEDAVRVSIKPEEAPMQERLAYEFSDLTDTSAVISLRWEKLRIPFRVDVDTRSIILANARNSYLRGSASFAWQGWNQAAAYCLKNRINLTEALGWADKSISMNENFTNDMTKAGLLEALGRAPEAVSVRKKAIASGTQSDLAGYGQQLLNTDKPADAIEIFKRITDSHPESSRGWDGLAQAYEKRGEKKQALESYSKALERTKDEGDKKRIAGRIEQLKAQ